MHRHLLSVDDLSREDIERILGRAESFAEVSGREIKKVPTLRGRTVINLFYEASTRTQSSFELAAKRLSADLVTVKSSGSAVDKGESLKDTVQTLSAYDPTAIVIRTPHAGAAGLVARWTRASVINAGDGKHEHPTQALLDLYTLKRRAGSLEGLEVWIVGDVLHSRVARSNVLAFTRMGCHVTVCGPPTLIPREIESLGCEVRYTLDELGSADVVYALRMQHERMKGSFVPSLREYAARNRLPHQWIDADTHADIAVLLVGLGVTAGDLPIAITPRVSWRGRRPAISPSSSVSQPTRCPNAATTSSSSAPDRRGWPRPCTPRRRVCAH